MKRLLLSISLLGFVLIAAFAQKAQGQEVSVSFQTFYDELQPYGQWVYDPVYGNVWVPNEEGDFRPYGSRGHWVMTDYGNTWVSEDPWGWACYHYGRWTYDSYYGWIWIPGYEWAPAWVSWRYGGGYCGWAPLGPGVTVGYGYNCPESWWVFVQPTYMYQRDCFHHWRGPSYNPTYIRQTSVIDNYYVDNHTHVRYNFGPRREVVEQATHQPVQVYRVSQMGRPGAPNVSGNRVSMYRPEVNRATVQQARPTKVIQAPRSIGRPAQQTTLAPTRQPQFRQEVQKHPEMIRPQGNRPEPQRGQPQMNRPEPQRPQPQMNRPEPQRPQPQMNRPEPQRPQPQMNRPEPQRPQPQMNRPEPQRPQPQMNRPEPQRPQPQINRPEPQRPQPQMNRPEPQRPQPQMNRPEPQRPQPQMQRPEPPRPQPQMNRPEPPRQQPMPQQQPRPQGPPPQQHEGEQHGRR